MLKRFEIMGLAFVLATVASMMPPSLLAGEPAGNEGPQGAPERPGAVIAEMTGSPGYMAVPRWMHLQILSNGVIRKKSFTRHGDVTEEKTSLLARLSDETLSRLVAKIDGIQAGPLLDLQEGQPECMDAPVLTYSVTPTIGERFAIGKWQGCHDFQLASAQGLRVLSMLRGLTELAQSYDELSPAPVQDETPGSGFAFQARTGGNTPVRMSVGTRFETTGEVVNWSHWGANRREAVVARLAPPLLQELRLEARGLVESPLIDEQAGEPMCFDVPNTSFSAVNSSGSGIAFRRYSGCHTFVAENRQGLGLSRALQAFSDLLDL